MIALAKTTAILLDHRDQSVRPVEYDGSLEALRILIGCKHVDAEMVGKDNILFVDQDAHNKKIKIGFQLIYGDLKIKWIGSGLLTGDDAGTNTALTIAPNEIDFSTFNVDYEK